MLRCWLCRSMGNDVCAAGHMGWRFWLWEWSLLSPTVASGAKNSGGQSETGAEAVTGLKKRGTFVTHAVCCYIDSIPFASARMAEHVL